MKSATVCGALLLAVGGLAWAQDEISRDETAQSDADPEVQEIDASAMPPTAERACFNSRTVRNFDAVSDRYIYLEAMSDEHYVLTMDGTCIGLRGANGIALSNPMSRVCSNDLARVSYRQFGRVETCRIRIVEQVESEEDARRLIASREGSRSERD